MLLLQLLMLRMRQLLWLRKSLSRRWASHVRSQMDLLQGRGARGSSAAPGNGGTRDEQVCGLRNWKKKIKSGGYDELILGQFSLFRDLDQPGRSLRQEEDSAIRNSRGTGNAIPNGTYDPGGSSSLSVQTLKTRTRQQSHLKSVLPATQTQKSRKKRNKSPRN